jgi:hypothetical protein
MGENGRTTQGATEDDHTALQEAERHEMEAETEREKRVQREAEEGT